LLAELYMDNFTIVDRLRFELAAGFNVLTGETGAGKSVVVDAVALAIGGRASQDYIRAGSDRAVIEALFHVGELPTVAAILEESGIETGPELVVTREVLREGRNICRINGRLATLNLVQRLGSHLVDIHGQHDHQSLLRPHTHLDLLDRLGGSRLLDQRRRVGELYTAWRDAARGLARIREQADRRQGRLEQLEYELKEIRTANPRPDEADRLTSELQVLANAERLYEAAAGAAARLRGGGGEGPAPLDSLGEAESALARAAAIDGQLGPIHELLAGARAQLQEALLGLRSYVEGLAADPGRLEQIQQRLHLLDRLKRKYGPTLEDVCAHAERALAELGELEDAPQAVARLERELGRMEAELAEAASRLSADRRGVGDRMACGVLVELSDLGMPSCRFEVRLWQEEDPHGIACGQRRLAVSADGVDRAEFLLSANPGEPVMPLARIASGGEMSRVMLALKTVLADADAIPTLIFDEVDAGIGGETSRRVGQRLARLGRERQVISVTHQPQIACQAKHHLRVGKSLEDGRTTVDIERLSPQARVDELARMLGGTDVTDAVARHARGLLDWGLKQGKGSG